MLITELDYIYPEELVAVEPKRPSRVAFIQEGQEPREISIANLLEEIPSGDLLVINTSQVIKRRVFTSQGLEILFVKKLDPRTWEVLFPSRDIKIGESQPLFGAIQFTLLEKGLPQRIELSKELAEEEFEKYGDLPLPPYIQSARRERRARPEDRLWYQSAWAEVPGSLAAPTASLHFSREDLKTLEARGVQVLPLVLHVGLGTFLPVKTKDLKEHQMHSEWVEIPRFTWEAIHSRQGQVWALGTTVVRALESAAAGLFVEDKGALLGSTDLFIQPGYNFSLVSRILTNFHQPKSTLLALVAGFAGLERVQAVYTWAIKNKFRLFSYGDLSVWIGSDIRPPREIS